MVPTHWRSGWRRFAFLLCLSALTYVFALVFCYPRYFDPFVPHHPDMYLAVGYHNYSLTHILSNFPRPVYSVLFRALGDLGISGSIATIVLLVLSSAVLAAVTFTRAAGTSVRLGTFLLYAFLLFAHPQFYAEHRHDFPSILALLFSLFALQFYLQYVDLDRNWAFLATAAALTAAALSKETYVIAALLLLLAIAITRKRPLPRATLELTILTTVTFAAFAFNLLRYRQYVAVSSGAAYGVDLQPLHLVSLWWAYGKALCSVAAIPLLALAMYAARVERQRWLTAGFFIIAGLCALVPNSALPDHFEPHYAWVAAPLLFAPILLIGTSPRTPPALYGTIAVVLATAWLFINRFTYNSTSATWFVDQEQATARIYRALSSVPPDSSANRILVSGLDASYHPWLAPDYLAVAFGKQRHWTVMVTATTNTSSNELVTLRHPSGTDVRQFDAAYTFDSNGHLIQLLQGASYRTVAQDNAKTVSTPALAALERKLLLDDNNGELLLQAGEAAVRWGWFEEATRYLKTANVKMQGRNPYPHFFMGQAYESLNQYPVAMSEYQQAIQLDTPPGNPVFRTALNQLIAKAH